jgi:hypothetical protein
VCKQVTVCPGYILTTLYFQKGIQFAPIVTVGLGNIHATKSFLLCGYKVTLNCYVSVCQCLGSNVLLYMEIPSLKIQIYDYAYTVVKLECTLVILVFSLSFWNSCFDSIKCAFRDKSKLQNYCSI